MKTACILLAALLFLASSCEQTGDTVVGSPEDTTIPGLRFTIDTTYLDVSGNRLIASGGVANQGSYMISSPWYVEGQFYTDGGLTTKLGGNYAQIKVPLSPGQSTFWTIYFSSSNVDVKKYPGFRIANLRGIYK